ncbi:chorionic somatomammotropin hormone-like [Capricornis sumatraensis]|uniref:chorionic somatomammotropin hormone-like n=1 Tax=Capricornis sumatraensis TaxID=34865 RepID=UPI0036046A68
MAPASSHHEHQWICNLVRGSRLLLLLVVSNLILCQGQENYPPYCQNQPGNCQIPLQSLFGRATTVANNNFKLAWEVFNKFDEQYGQGINSEFKVINNCHTSSIRTPNNKGEARNTEDKILFKLVISLLHSWDEPLHHAVTELANLKGASPALLTKAQEIKDKAKVLLEGVEVIQKRIHPGEKNEPYPVWSEQSSLTAQDENVRQAAFYRLFHCLYRDSNKINTYLQILKCRLTSCGAQN